MPFQTRRLHFCPLVMFDSISSHCFSTHKFQCPDTRHKTQDDVCRAPLLFSAAPVTAPLAMPNSVSVTPDRVCPRQSATRANTRPLSAPNMPGTRGIYRSASMDSRLLPVLLGYSAAAQPSSVIATAQVLKYQVRSDDHMIS